MTSSVQALRSEPIKANQEGLEFLIGIVVAQSRGSSAFFATGSKGVHNKDEWVKKLVNVRFCLALFAAQLVP